jgi:formylglycine-generating enzyme required for sulfatase activity
MARIFVSYSRSVKDEVQKVVDLLRASGHDLWWDGDIPIMADWWATILTNIEWCEVFIFVTSKKSVQSLYCLAELKYANERNRPILPFILDDHTKYTLPDRLPRRGQWLIYDDNPAQMLKQINEAYDNLNLEQYRDIDAPRPPEPNTGGISLAKQYQEARQLASEMKFDDAKKLLRNIKLLDYGEWGKDCDEWLARLNIYPSIADLADDKTTHQRAVRAWRKFVRQYGDNFDPYDIEGKLEDVSDISHPPSTKAPPPKSKPRQKEAVKPPIVTIPLPQQSQKSTNFMPVIIGLILIATFGITLFVMNMVGFEAASDRARNFNGIQNSDWEPFTYDFNGVAMMLVPVGCFTIGSDDGDSNELNGNEICFEEPFWIDKTEVTQGQLSAFNFSHNNNYVGVDLPADNITWFEARDFCKLRDGRLPSEAEWEYAARGPDRLIYPWGNSSVANRVDTSSDQTMTVGSFPRGASWVGALDMNGNVQEWTNSLYRDYPYDASDGREEDTEYRTGAPRVLRGGSYLYSVIYLRAANRDKFNPVFGSNDRGFRCARSYDE